MAKPFWWDRRPKGHGPNKWCKTCSRYHVARKPCDLYLRERESKSGRKVQRWSH